MNNLSIKISLLGAAAISLIACGQPHKPEQNSAEQILAELHNPESKNVVVVSHRGDWRNWPENSIPAI